MRGFLRCLQRDEGGQSAVLFALSIFVILLMIGFGVDLGRAHLARAVDQAALDAASLAGAQAVTLTTQPETICDVWTWDQTSSQWVCTASHTVAVKWLTMSQSQVQANVTQYYDANINANDPGYKLFPLATPIATVTTVPTSGGSNVCQVEVTVQVAVPTTIMRSLGAGPTQITIAQRSYAQTSSQLNCVPGP